MARARQGNGKDPGTSETVTLHGSIYQELAREISEGVYGLGDRMPSEAALCERFGASRITVAKAIQSLQRDGPVTRRAGSGTYVQRPTAGESHQFGLLIPQLGSTEIFEPICQGIMRAPLAKSHVLLWGHASNEEESAGLGPIAEQLCRQLIDQKVAGIFFAPLEYTPDRDIANHHVIEMLAKAKIPVVLLDRSLETYPDRSPLDLVGIDNHRAGYIATRHLWQQGARRVVFVAHERSASTIIERLAGCQFALSELGGKSGRAVLGDAGDPDFVRKLLEEDRPDGIICGNDLTAARLMRCLLDQGVSIPRTVRLVGFDDVSYSQFLPVPLTTIRQNCSEIGRAALSLMLARLREPGRTPWEVRVPFQLVVRQSCGGGAITVGAPSEMATTTQ